MHMFRYFLLGRGDTAPVTREIIRSRDPGPARRPASTSAAEPGRREPAAVRADRDDLPFANFSRPTAGS